MENTINLTEQRLADAWAVLQSHAEHVDGLKPDANRLAFADPEFLLRREMRGMRMQMELLKPELGQVAAGVHNTVVVNPVENQVVVRNREGGVVSTEALTAAAGAGADLVGLDAHA